MTSSDLKVRGRAIRQDDDGFISVTDIHTAAGFKKNQRPSDYARLPQWRTITNALHEKLYGKSGDYKVSRLWRVRNQGQGTFAHPVLALAYAEYLNPKLAVEVKQVFLRFKAADPVLADDILERATPEENEWAARRALSRTTRNVYTRTLNEHGVTEPRDYASCTNETYKALLGGTAVQVRKKRGLTKKANVRDSLSLRELTSVMFCETLSAERIDAENCAGPKECRSATARSAKSVQTALDMEAKDRQPPLL